MPDSPIHLVFNRYVDWATEEQIRIHTGKNAGIGHVPDTAAIFIATDGIDPENQLPNWLRQYGVLQGNLFRQNNQYTDNTNYIVDNILTFYQEENINILDNCIPNIVSEFKRLNQQIRQNASNEINNRSFLSLTSKALWCKYPANTPIYDKNARIALQALVRMNQADVPYAPNQHDTQRPRGLGTNKIESDTLEYEVYVRNYFDIYQQISDCIGQKLETCDYNYPIRIFDKILWTFGSDNRDIPHRIDVYRQWQKHPNQG